MDAMPMSKEFDQRVEEFFRNYQDRGMKKWAGFFLSDHSLKINKDNQKRRTVYCKKSPMTQNEIRKSLMKSFAEHRQIAVQIKEITEDNQVKPNIIGFVEGYQEDAAIISNHFVNINDINHIDFNI